MIDYKNNNIAIFDGYRFVRDKKTDYYLSSKHFGNGCKIRLHRYVWEYYNGLIPKGWSVHHKDGDKRNNNIGNLTIMPMAKHNNIHCRDYMKYHGWRERFEVARQKGSDAHKRPEERLKQSQRSKEQWARRKAEEEPDTIVCQVCGGEKKTYCPERTIYCSKVCKARAFRKNFKEKHGYGYDKELEMRRSDSVAREQSKAN